MIVTQIQYFKRSEEEKSALGSLPQRIFHKEQKSLRSMVGITLVRGTSSVCVALVN
jgi:hypothetical protein